LLEPVGVGNHDRLRFIIADLVVKCPDVNGKLISMPPIVPRLNSIRHFVITKLNGAQ